MNPVISSVITRSCECRFDFLTFRSYCTVIPRLLFHDYYNCPSLNNGQCLDNQPRGRGIYSRSQLNVPRDKKDAYELAQLRPVT